LEETIANSAPGGASDYNTKIIEEFRANEGRVGGPWAGIPLILIHHVVTRQIPVFMLTRQDRPGAPGSGSAAPIRGT